MLITSWLKKGQSLKRPRTDGLPDPTNCHDELDAKICASANERIDQLLTEPPTKRRKRGEYGFYNDQTRFAIAKSSIEIGVAKTTKKFTKELGRKVNESTVCSMKKNYLLKLKKGEEPTSLPKSPRGKPLMLGDLDELVQSYISNARLNGAAVCSRMVMAAAEGIVTISITKTWAQSLLKRMGYVQRKGTKDVKHLPKDFDQLKENWLQKIDETTKQHSVPDDLILNWDQTGCQLTPGEIGQWRKREQSK